jgi:uncharacterized protein YcaQ
MCTAEAADPQAAYDALVDVVLAKYAPLPELSLNMLVSRVRYGAPQWTPLVRAAVARAKQRSASAPVDGLNWYWPAGENPASRRHQVEERVRLLAPFDPVVWDRRRFELFWGWPIASRPTRLRRSACAATTRCRCCGAIRSSAGATSPA